MRRLRALLQRLAGLLPSARREREMQAELESHLRLHMDDNLRSGMTLREARRDAILKLGGVESTKQVYREAHTIPWLENLLGDGRFALRQLRKNPGFTSAAIFILALGICASVSIFAFVDAALLKPLPYRDAGRLVGAFETVAQYSRSNVSYFDYLDWKAMNEVFSSLDAYRGQGMMLSTATGTQAARGAHVSDGFFRTLGVTPVLGRDFRGGEDLLSAPRTAMLSYSAWQNRYGGKSDVLGKTVVLDGDAHVIIGVLPRSFHFAPAEPAEFWTTLHASSECDLRRSCHSMFGVARLKDGVSVQSALANMQAIAKRLEQQHPDSNLGQGANVVALSEVIVGNIRPILLMLLSGAGLLLLIASVNVASLLLVRSESRRREMSVRRALGASTGRLFSQFVTEGLVLVAGGSILGLASAHGVMQLLVKLIPVDMLGGMPYLSGLGLNGRVLAFAGAVGMLAAILFSFTPALRLSLLASPSVREGLSEGSRGSAGNTWRRLGSKLVVLELATAMVLLAGAGLLGKSLFLLLHVSLGFQPDDLTVLYAVPPRAGYEKTEQFLALERRLIGRIGRVPGVTSVAITSVFPVSHWGNTTWFRVLGRPWHGEHNDTPERDVSPSYFTTLGAKLLRGRYFTEGEDTSKPPVAIVNRAFQSKYFPGEDALGKQISFLTHQPKPIQIVGVVEDIKEGALDTNNQAVLYVPFDQNPDSSFGFVIRTSQVKGSALPALAKAIHEIDPDIVVDYEATMNERINRSPSAYMHRSSAWLVGGFALVALVLGAVGLYGVVAYSVSQRTREIGVRMALGAESGAVYRLILSEAGWLTALGIGLGSVLSILAAKLMHGLLFGVTSWDVPTLVMVATAIGIAALLASYFPARRAASVSPIEALRAE